MERYSVGRPNGRAGPEAGHKIFDLFLKRRPAMGGFASVLYGVLSYLLFFCTFLYAIVFVGNLPVPNLPVSKTIDSGTAGPLIAALIINIHLLGLFAIQHSVMARPAFKRWWTKVVPQPVERTTYVLLASLVLLLLYWQWRPMPELIWSVTSPGGVAVLQAIFWLGWAVLLISTFLLNHFELFGLLQVWARLRGRTLPEPVFKMPFFYKRVRHPIYLGFLLAFWATPSMTVGHLLFAIGTSGYILLGIWLEERDLIALFGDQYRRYRQRVPMLIPLPGRKAVIDDATGPRAIADAPATSPRMN
jgi:protein-S-isoprenylcysteine O-methyltransferase Ste14